MDVKRSSGAHKKTRVCQPLGRRGSGKGGVRSILGGEGRRRVEADVPKKLKTLGRSTACEIGRSEHQGGNPQILKRQ